MASKQAIRGAVFALCLILACAQQMSYNDKREVQAENELFCNDVNMTMFFNKTALDERHYMNGMNNRPYRIYYEGQRNTKGCYMDKSFDRNIVPQSAYDKMYEGINMTMFNNSWCSEDYQDGFYLKHERCITFIRNFNESWCNETFMDGMFKHTWCQYNFSQINHTWCEKDYQNGVFRDHPRCQLYFSLDFKEFNASVWCQEGWNDNILDREEHPFCHIFLLSLFGVDAVICSKNYQYRDFEVGVFYDHPICRSMRSRFPWKNFDQSWCPHTFEQSFFMNHHFCRIKFNAVKSTWCNKDYKNGDFMEHPRCHQFFSYNLTNFNESWCKETFDDGLFMDHVFCQYNNSEVNASYCSMNFEKGMFLKHPFCRNLYKNYDYYNFNYTSMCNETFDNGIFLDHALCKMNFSEYNITNFNNKWCSRKYENGLFLHHPFCQYVFDGYNIDKFQDDWCSMDYEMGIFLEHPKCRDVTANETTFYRVRNEARFTESVFLASRYDRCGINVYSDNDYITFNQTIVVVYGDDSTNNNKDNNLIEREEKDYYYFMCRRNRTIVEKLFGGGYFNTTFRQAGRREDNVTRAFELTLSHANMENKRQDIYQLGDYMKFRLQSHTSYKNVKAVVQQCWTTSDGYNDKKYMLIDNRCTRDGNTFWMSQNRSMSEFKVEAFRYLGAVRNAIYMECHVRMCTMDDMSSQCEFCDDKNVRNRRSADEEESKENVQTVKSPVFYIIERPQPAAPVQGNSSAFTGTNGTIIIILLSAMVFIGFVLIIKKFFFTPTALENKTMLLERA